MATVKDTLASNIIGHWDFRKGTLVDQSVNSNNGTFGSTPYWHSSSKGLGIQFDGVATYIDVGNTSQTVKSIYMVLNPRSITSTTDYIIDLNGTDFITLVNGTITVNGFAAAATAIYSNGVLLSTVLAGQYNAILITSDTGFSASDLDIGRLEGTGFADIFVNEVVLFDVELTSLQASQLYEESLQEAFILDLPKRNFQLPELMAFNEFQQDSIWTKGTGWTIATGKASSDGSQAAVSDLTQAVGVVGNKYTIEYSVSGYSAGNVTGLAGDATGAARAANGVFVDVIVATSDTDLGLQADADFVGDIDYVRIGIGNKFNYRNTFEDAPVTVTALGSGDVGDFHVDSGTWKITDDGTDKWLENATAGIANIPLNKSFGTWEVTIQKASAGDLVDVMLLADVKGGGGATGQDGYGIRYDTDDTLALIESVNGTPTDLITTGGPAIDPTAPIKVRVTRAANGAFELFADDVSIGTATDTTVVSNNLVVLDMDAGDKISKITFFEGVIDPTA